MRKKEELSLTLPADFSYLHLALSYVREAAKRTGLSKDDTENMVLAADEAVSNVMKHAFKPEQEGTFNIICEVSSLGLKVIVQDKGYPFSPEKVEEYSIEKVLKEGKTTGLGTFLMKHSVDECCYRNKGFEGKEVQLVKYLHQKHIEDYLDGSQLVSYEKPTVPPEKPVEKINYRVECLDAGKSIEISQCAYRTYGYNYLHEFIYYPERISEMNAAGELISVVAVKEDTGEIMSHAALEVTGGKDLVELGVAFTKPEFRHQGCFKRICEYLMDIAAKEKIKGVFATAVTIHPFSQKAILRNAFKECGILMALAPAAMFKDSLEHGEQRESTVILFRNIDQDLDKPLYAPARHEQMLKEIYSNIGVPVEWRAQPRSAPVFTRKKTEIETKIYQNMATADIYINKYGEDIAEELRHTIKDLMHKKIDVVYLYLDLADPLTSVLAKDFEGIDFFFAGVMPRGGRQDLILQFLDNVKLDYKKICAASDFSGKMLSYIRGLDPNQSVKS